MKKKASRKRGKKKGIGKMEEIYATIKAKKPFWLPKFIWNSAINRACDSVLEYAKVERLGEIAATGITRGVEKAVNGKSASAVKAVCTVAEKGSDAFSKIANAAKDKKITSKEEAVIAKSIADVVSSLVSQDDVNAKIEEARCALLFL